MSFEWDEKKNRQNQRKHGVPFEIAQKAFLDEKRIIARDTEHSTDNEQRYYYFGDVGDGILTVRFTYRNDSVRILGAGYWRKGKRAYEQKTEIH